MALSKTKTRNKATKKPYKLSLRLSTAAYNQLFNLQQNYYKRNSTVYTSQSDVVEDLLINSKHQNSN